MPLISYFPFTPSENEIPSEFPSPFTSDGEPHSLANQAALQLQLWLNQQTDWQHDFFAADGGKMFGVLVVRDKDGRLGFLRAFSGMLAGQWLLPDFVPPLFDVAVRETFMPEAETELAAYTQRIETLLQGADRSELMAALDDLKSERAAVFSSLQNEHQLRKAERQTKRAALEQESLALSVEETERQLERLSFESQRDRRELRLLRGEWLRRFEIPQKNLQQIEESIEQLKQQRAKFSRELHKKIFSTYMLSNQHGEKKQISAFFEQGLPPGGAGDCAGPKLIHAAQQQHLEPIALAEFWWGAPPANGVRHHAHYYPACRGKCRPILPFMLSGVKLQTAPVFGHFSDEQAPTVIYEDELLLVVNKPSGLLSVPGKEVLDSVETRLQARYPDAEDLKMVHRLDMCTSGLLLAAKTAEAYKALQQQFNLRTVEKRYVAVLSKSLVEEGGVIELPLRVDLYDRPRQLVCYEYGKPAKTRWQVIERKEGQTRVYFYPVTGRTHQLRLHASHQAGLDAPIVGDALYGESTGRLLLHAQQLCFDHPVTGKRMVFDVPTPF